MPGSCAWRCRRGRPCAMPRATSPCARRSEMRSRSAKFSRSSPATTASFAPLSAQKVRKKSGQRRREIGDDRAASSSLPMTSRPPGPVTCGQYPRRTGDRVRSASRPSSPLPLRRPPYEALNFDGEALASRRQLAASPPSPISACRRSRCTSGRSTCAGTASPISPASSSAIGTCSSCSSSPARRWPAATPTTWFSMRRSASSSAAGSAMSCSTISANISGIRSRS